MKLIGDFINLIPWLPLKTVWSENCSLATWPNDEVIYFSSIINGTNWTNVRKKEGLKNTFDRECSLWDFSSGRRTTIFLSYFRSLFLLYISSLTNDDFVFYRGRYFFQTNKGSRKNIFWILLTVLSTRQNETKVLLQRNKITYTMIYRTLSLTSILKNQKYS